MSRTRNKRAHNHKTNTAQPRNGSNRSTQYKKTNVNNKYEPQTAEVTGAKRQ